ncbi:MAG: hypothetical protein SFV15_09220 [Polyangiaceae bacterium]|nr:hypothetical protein [Polyangiaceae bacterium]
MKVKSTVWQFDPKRVQSLFGGLSREIRGQKRPPGGYAELADEIGRLAKERNLVALDRRKLAALGEEVLDADLVLTLAELTTLDEFLRHKGGLGFFLGGSERSVLHYLAQSRLGATALVACHGSSDGGQDTLARFDADAFSVLKDQLRIYTEGRADLALSDVFTEMPELGATEWPEHSYEMFRNDPWLSGVQKDTTNLVIIGSPRRHLGACYAVAHAFGFSDTPFKQPNEEPSLELPFRFYWQEASLPSKVCYASSHRPSQLPEGVTQALLPRNDDPLCIKKQTGEDYDTVGVVAVHRKDRKVAAMNVLAMGLDGPGTLAAAKYLPKFFISERDWSSETQVFYQFLRAPVHFDHSKRGDPRRLSADPDPIGPVHQWPR